MHDWNATDAEIAEVYMMFWRFVDLVVHRFGSAPTGALLTVLTISLLDRVDYHPTIGELAGIIRLPKSTVSRYVSTDMNAGYLEERIDPEDRRRRRLHSTDKARQERKWVQDNLLEIASMSGRVFRDKSKDADPGAELKRILAAFGEKN